MVGNITGFQTAIINTSTPRPLHVTGRRTIFMTQGEWTKLCMNRTSIPYLLYYLQVLTSDQITVDDSYKKKHHFPTCSACDSFCRYIKK
jgi:hypothetical protein